MFVAERANLVMSLCTAVCIIFLLFMEAYRELFNETFGTVFTTERCGDIPEAKWDIETKRIHRCATL